MTTIRGLTFDVGGTLAEGYLDKKAFVSKALDYLSGLGHRVSVPRYKRALGRAMRELEALRSSGREMSFERFYSLVLSGLGIRADEELLAGLKDVYFSCFVASPVPGVEELLAELSGRYELAVISNSMSSWPRVFLERERLARYFKAIVISGEVGWKKPHRRIFQVALTRMGLEASEAVHVGNSPEDDILGAKSVGMRAVLLWPSGGADASWPVEPDATIRSLGELPRVLEELDPP